MRAGRLAAVLLAAGLLGPDAAHAGTYTVRSCADASGVNNAWSYVEGGPAGQLLHGSGCGGSGEFAGLWVRDAIDAPANTPPATRGHWRLSAPAGTTVTGITYTRFLHAFSDPDWRAELRTTSGFTLESCSPPTFGDTCELGASGGGDATFNAGTHPAAFPASGIEMGIRCVATSICVNGGTFAHVKTILYGAEVRLEDPTSPTAGALTGTLTEGGWLRGTHTVAMTGSDAIGIKRLDLTRDGGQSLRSRVFACDYSYTAPCQLGSAGSAWADVNTALLADGEHTLVGTAVDAADNRTDLPPITVRTDNEAPEAPLSISADGAWSSAATRSLSWQLPPQTHSPIAGAEIRVCPPGGGACTTSGAATTTSGSVTLTQPGTWQGSVYLRDAAGNSDPLKAASFVLRYDPDPPAPPQSLTASGAWSSAASRILTWSLPLGQLAPIAAATVRLCPPGGGSCTDQVSGGTTSGNVTLTAPGAWTGRVFLTDQAGNSDPDGGAPFTVRYDPDPPPAPALGAPEQQGTTAEFFVPVASNDPGPAPLDRLAADLCRPDGTACNVVNPTGLTVARFVAPGPGQWRARVRAVDAAGNLGAWAETAFTYTAPATPTPTPTPTVAGTASPTATPTLTAEPNVTTTATPSATPSSTVTPEPRADARLAIRRARLRGRRIKVVGSVSAAAAGRVRVKVRAKRRIRVRDVMVIDGVFTATARLPKRTKRAHIIVRYFGDSAHGPATVRRTARR